MTFENMLFFIQSIIYRFPVSTMLTFNLRAKIFIFSIFKICIAYSNAQRNFFKLYILSNILFNIFDSNLKVHGYVKFK